MDFLKDILGTELYEKMDDAVNAYNSDEANNKKIMIINNESATESHSTYETAIYSFH